MPRPHVQRPASAYRKHSGKRDFVLPDGDSYVQALYDFTRFCKVNDLNFYAEMMKLLRGRMAAVAVLCLMLTGCGPAKRAADVVFKPPALIDAGKSLAHDGGEIVAQANDGQAAAPTMPQWEPIKGYARSVIKTAGTLDAMAKAGAADAARCKKLEEENVKLKDEAEKANRALWKWLQFICAIAVIGSAGLAYFSPKLAIPVAIAGVAGVGFATFMLSYGWLVNLIVGLTLLLGFGLVVAAMWHKFRLENRDAEGMARLARDAEDKSQPETWREFIAALRIDWPEFSDAWSRVRASGNEPGKT